MRFLILVFLSVLILSCKKGKIKSKDLFDDSYVHRIDIEVESSDFANIIQYKDSNIIIPVSVIIEYQDKKEKLEKVGFRIKGNASRGNPKKSYKLSFNAFEKGKKYVGLKKLNLNAHWNDPTHIRSHLSTKLYEYASVKVPRSSFSDLYINGVYHGLYSIGEQIDEAFTKNRFKSKKGNIYKCLSISSLSYFGDSVEDYSTDEEKENNYILKNNKKKNDYSGLIDFIDLLNNTPIDSLECVLEKRFNIEDYIKIMAIDILLANWDDYMFTANNFYLYDNPKTGKMEFIPYDFDNTFGIDWVTVDWTKKDIYNWAYSDEFLLDPDSVVGLNEEAIEIIKDFQSYFYTDVQRPLYYRILEVDNYRNKYNYHLDNLMLNYFNNEVLDGEIDRLMHMLSPSLKVDTLDNFTWDQIETSIDAPLDVYTNYWEYKHHYLPYGLKDFIKTSNANIQSQIEKITPLVIMEDIKTKEKEEFYVVKVKAESSLAFQINIHIKGRDLPLRLKDDGIEADKMENDGTYSVSIPKNEFGEYFLLAEMNNGEIVRKPCKGYLEFK